MKLRFLILIVFLAVVAHPGLSRETNRPLGKDQVLDLATRETARHHQARVSNPPPRIPTTPLSLPVARPKTTTSPENHHQAGTGPSRGLITLSLTP